MRYTSDVDGDTVKMTINREDMVKRFYRFDFVSPEGKRRYPEEYIKNMQSMICTPKDDTIIECTYAQKWNGSIFMDGDLTYTTQTLSDDKFRTLLLKKISGTQEVTL